MKNLGLKKILGILAVVVVLIALPVIILQTQKSQDIRQRAAGVTPGTGDTKIYLFPDSGYQVAKSTTFNVQLKIDAKDKSVANFTIELIYDSHKFTYNSLQKNADKFDSVIANPNIATDHIRILAEADPTTPVAGDVVVATLTFTSTNETGTSEISFAESPLNVVGKSATGTIINLTAEAADVSYTVVATTITPTATPTTPPCVDGSFNSAECPTSTPPVATVTPMTTAVPTATLVPTATPVAGNKRIKFNVQLPGIGNGAANLGLNPSPIRPQRTATVVILNSQNVSVTTATGILTYGSGDPGEQGRYSGMIDVGKIGVILPVGTYNAKIKFENTLFKNIPGTIQIMNDASEPEANNTSLISGDLNDDNTLGIIDWTLMIACVKNESACTANIRALSDLNDNGSTDELDVQILQRGFAIRSGD